MSELLATTIEVTCPECLDTYNLRTNESFFRRNCKCSKGTWKIQLFSGRGHVHVTFINRIGVEKEFENWRIVSQS